MHIQQLTLKNFRGFKEVPIAFSDDSHSGQPSKTIVFVGDNGAGKTAILDALKISLSWLVARINRDKGKGFDIPDKDIQNGQTFADIAVQLQYEDNCYPWRI